MASAICTPTFSSSRFTTKSAIYTSSSSLFSHSKTPKFHLSTWFPPLGRGVFSPWSGLKHLGISIAPKPLKSGTFFSSGFVLCFLKSVESIWNVCFAFFWNWNDGGADRKGRCKGKVVYASLFGVGAPEALVIGVVALLVFGPKGLAEVSCLYKI